jgi:cobaltochelatase CobT
MSGTRSTELRRDAEGKVRHGAEWLLLWADPDAIRSAEARAKALAGARQRTTAEKAVAAALRAVAHRGVEVVFEAAAEDGRLEGARARLPTLDRPPEPDVLATLRGSADAIAARLRHHDPALGRALAPADPALADLVRVAELARCEALAARHMPGLLHNLAAHSAARLERLGFAHARLAGDLPPAEALAVVLRRAFAADNADLPSIGLRMWDHWLRARLGPELTAMQAALADQAGFARAAARFAAAFRHSLGQTAQPGRPDAEEGTGTDEAAAQNVMRTAAIAIMTESDETGADASPERAPAHAASVSPPRPYAAFTLRHDRIVLPRDVCEEAELIGLRAALDAESEGVRNLLARLASQLARRLLAQQRRSWDFDLEEGLLDAGKLDRVVVTPSAPLSFKQERDSTFRDTVAGLLIDCSGSMRGRPIRLAAIAADICARALERCGVASEVLGFTTADFGGGRSAADWREAGSPPLPGRLGDLRHIVIKAADTPYRTARLGFGLLLKPDLLRENVDGEALAWAHARLLARRERRRVLVVISDGAPAEGTTLRANPPDLLDRHLGATIASIDTQAVVELRAIGIRHDVSARYRRAVTIPDAQLLGPALIAQLSAVFDAGTAR